MVILRIIWDACLKMQTTIGSAVYWNLRFKAQCFQVWLSSWCFSGNVHCFSPNIEHSHSKIKNTAKGILIPLQVFNNGLRIYPDSKIFTDSSQAQAWTFRVQSQGQLFWEPTGTGENQLSGQDPISQSC